MKLFVFAGGAVAALAVFSFWLVNRSGEPNFIRDLPLSPGLARFAEASDVLTKRIKAAAPLGSLAATRQWLVDAGFKPLPPPSQTTIRYHRSRDKFPCVEHFYVDLAVSGEGRIDDVKGLYRSDCD